MEFPYCYFWAILCIIERNPYYHNKYFTKQKVYSLTNIIVVLEFFESKQLKFTIYHKNNNIGGSWFHYSSTFSYILTQNVEHFTFKFIFLKSLWNENKQCTMRILRRPNFVDTLCDIKLIYEAINCNHWVYICVSLLKKATKQIQSSDGKNIHN